MILEHQYNKAAMKGVSNNDLSREDLVLLASVFQEWARYYHRISITNILSCWRDKIFIPYCEAGWPYCEAGRIAEEQYAKVSKQLEKLINAFEDE
mgnify:CR=1 FL=1